MSTDYSCTNPECGNSGNRNEVNTCNCDLCNSPMVSMFEIEGALEDNDTEFFNKYPHLAPIDDW
jgi:hypothetical protein